MLKAQEVVLIYSPETREPRDCLDAALTERQIPAADAPIADATDAREIRDECGALTVDHLHYSGGTKPMAAHARQSCGLGESQASYLDERKRLLRFDDGYDASLGDCRLGLTLDVLLALHGSERKGAPRPDGADSTLDDEALAKAALGGARRRYHPVALHQLGTTVGGWNGGPLSAPDGGRLGAIRGGVPARRERPERTIPCRAASRGHRGALGSTECVLGLADLREFG